MLRERQSLLLQDSNLFACVKYLGVFQNLFVAVEGVVYRIYEKPPDDIRRHTDLKTAV